MALSGKTSNFELKYPALVDDIVMGESGNDFKEMMDSVDIALRDSIFKTVEPGTDLNTLTTGLFKLAWPLTNDPSPSLGLRYLMAMSGPPGNAQYYFADNGKIYYRFSTPSGSTTTGEWKEIATEEIVGDLTDLATTAKTDLVSAVNELKTNILDGGIVDLGLVEGDLMDDRGGIDSSFLDVTTAGIYKFSIKNNGSETVDGYLIVSNNTTVTDEFDQWLFVGGSLLHRVSSAGGLGDWNGYVTTNTAGRYSKKYSTIVIGNSGSGVTANDVDYLYEEGSDFGTVLSSAIRKLTDPGAKGGEIKILSGIYTLTSAVTTYGTTSAPIKITGEGRSTIITSSTPTSYYIIASCCEISECRLDTDIRITSNGYVNIHDCEIAERIYFNNSSTLQDIFIHDNNLNYTTTGKDFLYLSGFGTICNFQVYNNYYYGNVLFYFLSTAASKTFRNASIRNNHCPYGIWNSSTDLSSTGAPYWRSRMTGNTFYAVSFNGSYWCISNNHITGNLHLYGGDYLDVMNNRVDSTFKVESGLTYANIVGNVFDSIVTASPYVNLGTNARFANNVIRNTNFNTAYIPGYNITSNKWGNNMWANGFDRMIFANGEGIGEGQGDA